MQKIVLIGGGEIGRGNTQYETKKIDEEIVRMTEKSNPIFLFIGLASSYSDSYYNTIKKIYQSLGCTTLYLKKKNLENNISLAKQKINDADIIYIGGGDTIKLSKEVTDYELASSLQEALERGSVLVGYSAGAILLSNMGFSDSKILRGESEHYEMIKGLGFTDIIICPHYHKEDKKTNELQEEIKKHKLEVYGLENKTAVKIIDNKIGLIRESNDNNIYLCTYDKKFREKILE